MKLKTFPLLSLLDQRLRRAHTFKKIMRDTYKTKSIKKNVVQNITHF